MEREAETTEATTTAAAYRRVALPAYPGPGTLFIMPGSVLGVGPVTRRRPRPEDDDDERATGTAPDPVRASVLIETANGGVIQVFTTVAPEDAIRRLGLADAAPAPAAFARASGDELARDGSPFDPVARPRHYNVHPSGVEAIELTEQLGFCLGNAAKYLWRAFEKRRGAPLEDLRKADWYLRREHARRGRAVVTAFPAPADPRPFDAWSAHEPHGHLRDAMDAIWDAAAAAEMPEGRRRIETALGHVARLIEMNRGGA